MNYNYFIETIKGYPHDYVTAMSFPDNCAMTQIPSTFGLLIPNILEIIKHNLTKFCIKNETISFFGLQPSYISITSDLPKILNRIINDQNPKTHFCCNLHYLIVKSSEYENVKSWKEGKSLIIDFTGGEVMNDVEYLNKLFYKNNAAGITYGWIDPVLLNRIWKILTKNEFRMISGANAKITN